MATANDLATAVNTYVKAAKDEAVTRINALNTKAAGYMGSVAPSTIYNSPIPTINTSLLNSDAGKQNGAAAEALNAGVSKVNTRITSGSAAISKIDLPPDIKFTSSPLDGWAGVDAAIKQPWDSVLRINTLLWGGAGLQAAYALVAEALQATSGGFNSALYDRSARIFDVLRSSMRVSPNPRLQSAQTTELNLMQNMEQTDLARTISAMLESYARDMYVQGVGSGVELDKIAKMFGIKFGGIYAKMTDALVAKANREVDWFSKDYTARAEMMTKSAGVNNDVYLGTLQAATEALLKEVETNIKVYLTNFEISLNVELEKFKFEKMDKAHELSLSELDVSLFKARLQDIYSAASEDMEDYTNFHTLEVQAYLALARGYSGLLKTASQGTLAVATSKG